MSTDVSARPVSAVDPTAVRPVLEEHRNARLDQIKALTFVDPESDELDPQSRRRALIAARLTVEEIDQALQRLDDGSYGLCLGCSGPIVVERLLTVPYTRYCVPCASIS